MTADPELHWLNPGNLAWFRGFVIRGANEHWHVASRHREPINGAFWSNLVEFRATEQEFLTKLRGHVASIIPHATTESGFAPIDQIPWEIHGISRKDARLAATRAFLLESRLTISVAASGHLMWPPGKRVPGVNIRHTVDLTFPTGEHTNYKIEP